MSFSSQYTSIAQYFFNPESITSFESYGEGHINATFKVVLEDNTQYILQGVNKSVFPEPQKIIENIRLLQESNPKNNLLLDLLPARNGDFFVDDEKFSWRLFPFALGFDTYQSAQNKKVANAVGQGYSDFLQKFSHIDAEKLHDTIPDFHNIISRFHDLKKAFENPINTERKEKSREYFEYLEKSFGDCRVLFEKIQSKQIPTRATHNDTKINNILISKDFKSVRVIDLDTIMKGSALFDFGDMCRSACNTGVENTTDEKNVDFSLEVFEWLCEGYAKNKDIFTIEEKENFFLSLVYMPSMLAMRFLADYLTGDAYFKVQEADENLIRARNQIVLSQQVLKKEGEIKAILKKYFDEEN